MNTHDKIELPPLPEWVGWPVTVSEMSASDVKEAMQDYAREAIEADRKRRGEPVAWLYEDELPNDYPYEVMYPYSKVDGVRMFPVYAPRPAEPVKVPSDDEIMSVVRYSTVGSAAIQDDEWCAFARAILARYGHISTNPEYLCASAERVQESAESIHEPTLEE